MTRTKVFLIVAVALVLWIVLAWLTGSWLGLAGLDLILLRTGLILLGLIGAGAFVWMYLREHRGDSTNTSPELDAAFREADSRLTSSARGGAKLAELPCLLIAGATGSAKTTVTIHSGLEPELLSGQTHRDSDVVPTSGVNIWYAQQNVLVELAGAQLNDPGSRAQLIRRLIPARLKSVVGKGQQAPRAVLVCVDCTTVLQSGGAESTAAAARQLNTCLTEIAHKLGIRLPVYVLFTKLDQVPHFREYVANMTGEEAAQVLGSTLPLSDASSGAYSETETRRLSAEFDALYLSLADRRPDLLSREHEGANLPPAYEFPREFRKLRGLMVQFLVDVCRPSQLQTSPFLRGFYFTGVRPFVVHDVVLEQPRQQTPMDSGATSVFRPGAVTPSPLAGSGGGGRRVPQWVFLNYLFSHVILRDQTAQSSSGSSVKVGMVRRVAMVAAMLLALIMIVGWTVSWFGNRALARDVAQTTEALPVIAPGGGAIVGEAPSLDELQRLEAERVKLEQLAQWQRGRPPMRLRWGLYAGNGLYESVHRAYFETFRRMLLGSTQTSLTRFMARPTGEAESETSVGYRPVYDALKAYLITTSHPDKSTREFLPPVLLEHWQGGRTIDDERVELIARQFDYYAGELPIENPFPDGVPEQQPVAAARAYLARFAATEAIYAAMLSAAGSQNPAFVFNQAYPGSAATVINTYPVPGAFTRGGWDFMKNAIDNPSEYFEGEEWVLGQQSIGNINLAELQQEIRTRYRSDFLMHWREYLQRTTVVRYASLGDAAAKLGTTSGNRSPLLLAICAVAENTNVDEAAVKDLFQPPALVGPDPCSEQPAKSENQGYRNALIGLQASLEQLGDNREDQNSYASATSAATSAQVAVRQLAGSFPIDREGGVDARTQALLEAPIDYAQSLIAGVPLQGVNSGAQGFCGQYRALVSKYPFNPQSPTQATLAEFDGIFRPSDGALWRMYTGNIDRFLVRQGNQYVANTGAGMSVTPQFQTFFNRMAAVSQAAYGANGQQANLSFRLRPDPSDTVRDVTLTIDGNEARYRNGQGDFQQFTWPGGLQEAKLRVQFSGGSEFDVIDYSGLWAPFRLFLEAERWQTAGAQHTMEWTARTTAGPMIIDGQPATVRFILDMGGAPAIFSPGYFSGLSCPATAVR